jgi:hypothetical protein
VFRGLIAAAGLVVGATAVPAPAQDATPPTNPPALDLSVRSRALGLTIEPVPTGDLGLGATRAPTGAGGVGALPRGVTFWIAPAQPNCWPDDVGRRSRPRR